MERIELFRGRGMVLLLVILLLVTGSSVAQADEKELQLEDARETEADSLPLLVVDQQEVDDEQQSVRRGLRPATQRPSKRPTFPPTKFPTTPLPTKRPVTPFPTSQAPSKRPTFRPTQLPSRSPTRKPTKKPTGTKAPTRRPTKAPVVTKTPTNRPTKRPTNQPRTRQPTKFPTKRATPSPTSFPTPQCAESKCGWQCMPFTATCCNAELGAICLYGDCIEHASGVWDCCAYGVCGNRCCPCPPDEHLCGSTCFPNSMPCCENNVACPSNHACVQTGIRASAKVCQDCGSRGLCGVDKCCACSADVNAPQCAGTVAQCCKVTTPGSALQWTCAAIQNNCCPNGYSCNKGQKCQACGNAYCCVYEDEL